MASSNIDENQEPRVGPLDCMGTHHLQRPFTSPLEEIMQKAERAEKDRGYIPEKMKFAVIRNPVDFLNSQFEFLVQRFELSIRIMSDAEIDEAQLKFMSEFATAVTSTDAKNPDLFLSCPTCKTPNPVSRAYTITILERQINYFLDCKSCSRTLEGDLLFSGKWTRGKLSAHSILCMKHRVEEIIRKRNDPEFGDFH